PTLPTSPSPTRCATSAIGRSVPERRKAVEFPPCTSDPLAGRPAMRADEAQHHAAAECQWVAPEFAKQRHGDRSVVQGAKPVLQGAEPANELFGWLARVQRSKYLRRVAQPFGAYPDRVKRRGLKRLDVVIQLRQPLQPAGQHCPGEFVQRGSELVRRGLAQRCLPRIASREAREFDPESAEFRTLKIVAQLGVAGVAPSFRCRQQT